MDDDQQMGFQGGGDDEGEMPPEMKAHMLAAFAHEAGVGPHPGMYKGPPRKRRDPDEITDTDMQRAEEEPLSEEASAAKMHAAQTGGGDSDLGPPEIAQQQAKQTTALQHEATTQGAQQAQQAQAKQAPVTPPEAPGGAAGQTQPYPAQAGPQPQAPVMPPPSAPQPPPPPGPGGPGGAPPEQEED